MTRPDRTANALQALRARINVNREKLRAEVLAQRAEAQAAEDYRDARLAAMTLARDRAMDPVNPATVYMIPDEPADGVFLCDSSGLIWTRYAPPAEPPPGMPVSDRRMYVMVNGTGELRDWETLVAFSGPLVEIPDPTSTVEVPVI